MKATDFTGGQELLCINTEKVYDWIINDADFNVALADVTVTVPAGTVCEDIATVTCDVTGATATEIGERTDLPFIIDGAEVTLQQVTISKTFDVTITVTLLDGTPVTSEVQTFTRLEQVTLCAPEGTAIEVEYTTNSCFVTSFNCVVPADGSISLTGLSVSLILCQSIQSTFPVTLELVAEFCQPRDLLPVGPCPAPTIPPQCPVLFPSNGDDDNGNVG
ncbi:hypothetical protein LG329_03385 [Virgibacillus necropolis]|uniref:hypothetical protein n=1 Tax=Virgibacillus necropolis TaxID=163877 RepID=UPI0038506AA2